MNRAATLFLIIAAAAFAAAAFAADPADAVQEAAKG